MGKREVLSRLRHGTWFRVQPSPLHGVGLFAIRRIPAGTELFPELRQTTGYALSARELSSLPPGVRALVRDYFVEADDGVAVPALAADGWLLASSFLNHSDTPNANTPDGGESFYAARVIRVGEEITVDYRTYGAARLLSPRRRARRTRGS
jgi:hypothetical protein